MTARPPSATTYGLIPPGRIPVSVGDVGGAAAGILAGQAFEGGIADGIPRDELFVYEDALRRGRSLVIAFADDSQIAGQARGALSRAGAESVDAARDEWWIGLRDAEREHYLSQGGDFNVEEAKYRLGFEAAMHPECRGKSCNDAKTHLKTKYGDDAEAPPFREGYARGQHYLIDVVQTHNGKPQAAARSQRAA